MSMVVTGFSLLFSRSETNFMITACLWVNSLPVFSNLALVVHYFTREVLLATVRTEDAMSSTILTLSPLLSVPHTVIRVVGSAFTFYKQNVGRSDSVIDSHGLYLARNGLAQKLTFWWKKAIGTQWSATVWNVHWVTTFFIILLKADFSACFSFTEYFSMTLFASTG